MRIGSYTKQLIRYAALRCLVEQVRTGACLGEVRTVAMRRQPDHVARATNAGALDEYTVGAVMVGGAFYHLVVATEGHVDAVRLVVIGHALATRLSKASKNMPSSPLSLAVV